MKPDLWTRLVEVEMPKPKRGCLFWFGITTGGLFLVIALTGMLLSSIVDRPLLDSNTEERPTTTRRQTTTTQATTTTRDPDVAFRLMTKDYVEKVAMSYREARSLGLGVCGILDQGESFEEFQLDTARMALEGGWSDAEIDAAAVVMFAGVAAYCPEHSWQLP